MPDSRCWRCAAKLLEAEDGTGSVVIVCRQCKAKNRVKLESPSVGQVA